MTIHKKWHGHGRLVSTLALAAVCASASFGAVSVTDVAVAPDAGGGVKLSYRLNQAATSVSIQIAGGGTVAGTTTKGLNTVTLPASASGKTASITATAAAPNGPGGAEVLIPATTPSGTTTARIVAVDVNRRAGSPYLGHIYLPSGFGVAAKRLYVYAPDGTVVQNKDLTAVASSSSFPYGFALAQGDTQDRMVVHNRSLSRDYVLGPDLALIADQGSTSNLVPGMAITPGSGNEAQPWNIWQAGPKDAGVRHFTSDLATNAGFTGATTSVAIKSSLTGEINSDDIAVDPSNRFLFKVNKSDGGVGPLDLGGANKWTSADNGASWTEDTNWLTNFLADVATDLTNAASTLTTNNLIAGGVTLGKDFNANNPAGSHVWIAVSRGTGTGTWNRIYKVNADSGHIDTAATINLEEIPTPEGGVAFSTNAAHFIEVDSVGNLAITLNNGMPGNGSGQYATWFAVLAPNGGTNTTTISGVDLTLPLTATGATSKARVANTGDQQVTFTISVADNAGIVADNVQVTADLTALKGNPSVALTRGTVSGDGKSANYTVTYTIPADVDLNNSGIFDIPFKVTATSNATGITTRVTQTVYNAYKPLWNVTTAGAVNSSAVTNGATAYIGDDAGNVYAIDTTTGNPAANFGGGSGSVSVGGPVQGKLEYFRGRLYVATPTRVVILNGGTGATLGSKDLAGVSSLAIDAVFPNSVFVAAGNTIVKLNAITAAQEAVTADLGAKVNRVAVIPSASFSSSPAMVVAGTEGEPSGDNAGKNGKIVALSVNDLSPANGTDAVIATDPAGAVRSRADWASDGVTNTFTIGGATGEWAFDADAITPLAWTAGSGGGANVGGNPYAAGAVDANPAFPKDASGTDPFGKEPLRIAFATTTGAVYLLNTTTGERSSYGGYPVSLTTTPDSGFAAGAGILAVNPSAADSRALYIGSDAVDQKFYGLNTKPDDLTYAATAAKRHIFDPTDASAFPGAVPGAFNSTPALAVDKVVVGSAAKRVYGFPSLTATQAGVISVTPSNGATGVAANAPVTLVFNAEVPNLVVDPFNTVLLLDDTGAPVSATASLQPDNKTLVIQPSSPLTANKTYTVVITREAGVQPFSSTFYTGVPPTVKGDVNGDGAFDINDVRAALRIAGGLQAATPQAITATGNKFTSGSITVEDAVYLARVLAGKDTL